jgi:hypothetical protein
MSQPQEPDPVKLISSIFSAEKEMIDETLAAFCEFHGPADRISRELLFDRTRYYAREMGWPLYRRFVSFENLIPPEGLVAVKLKSHEIEQRYLRNGDRRVNIDPGYVSAERLILATGKNYVHRVYLSGGIYADLTLLYRKGSFRPLGWTYPDYADPDIIAFFNDVREAYMGQLREMRRID